MSIFSFGIRCKVVSGTRDDDYYGVLTDVGVAVHAFKPVQRLVFDHKSAEWIRLKSELVKVECGDKLRNFSSDVAASWLTSTGLHIFDDCAPSKCTTDEYFSHPWINKDWHDALRIKRHAHGIQTYIAARDIVSVAFS